MGNSREPRPLRRAAIAFVFTLVLWCVAVPLVGWLLSTRLIFSRDPFFFVTVGIVWATIVMLIIPLRNQRARVLRALLVLATCLMPAYSATLSTERADVIDKSPDGTVVLVLSPSYMSVDLTTAGRDHLGGFHRCPNMMVLENLIDLKTHWDAQKSGFVISTATLDGGTNHASPALRGC